VTSAGEVTGMRANLLLAIVLLLTVGLYLPGLSGPLLLDDFSVLSPLMNLPAQQIFTSEYLLSNSGPLGRPISMLSFAINAAVDGADLWSWKATNLVLHLVTGVALYAFFATMLGLLDGARDRARITALLAASAWLVHPLQVSTVLYTVQRMTELSALFCVLGLLAYARGRVRMLTGRPGGARLIIVGFFVCTALAALSKETGLLLPLYIAALEVIALVDLPRPSWLKRLLWVCAVVPFIVGVSYVAINFKARVLNLYAIRDFTPAERLLTQARIVVTYLRWIIVPRRTDFGFYHDDELVAGSATEEPAVVAAMVLIVALLTAVWRWRLRAPVAAFGVILFFLGHALESTVFGLELMYEHRNYLPMAGIYLAVADLVCRYLPRRVVPVVGAAVVIILACATLPRTLLWGNEGRLYHAFVALHPHSDRALVTLAEWHSVRGAHNRALALLDSPKRTPLALHRLSVLCRRDGAPGVDAEAVLTQAAAQPRASNFSIDTLLSLAKSDLDQTCNIPPGALLQALEALRVKPTNLSNRYRLHVYLAMLYQRSGDPDAAFERLATAARYQPGDPFVHYLGAEWQVARDDLMAASAALAAARLRGGAQRYPEIDHALAASLAAALETQSTSR
jgi:hypothetical protein